MKIATSEQMRNIDRRAIEGVGIPGLTLMENAGKGVLAAIESVAGDVRGKNFAIVCGKGNNGGDGFVVARLLREGGAHASAFLLAKSEEVGGDAAVNLKRFVSMGGEVRELSDANVSSELGSALGKAHFVVDAIYGTGFKGRATGPVASAIELVNSSNKTVVSIDVPSGLDCDTGRNEGPCVRASATATLALLKKGLLLYPGRRFAGEIFLVDIGIPNACVEDEQIDLELVDNILAREWFPGREPDVHKGDCGKVAVVGGSVGLTGAVVLCSMAALRAGAGLVTAAVPESLNDIFEVKMTEPMTKPVPETGERSLSIRAKDEILRLTESYDILALGPGLSRNTESASLARAVVPSVGKPCVLDADGLNAFIDHQELLAECGKRLIITPHVVEMSRLCGEDPDAVSSKRVDVAKRFAEEMGIVVLLKGAPTIVAQPGGSTYVNPTGNAGLASGGSGDVLTGVIAGLLGQGLTTVQAAALGAYLHGLAADVAKEKLGEEGMIAGDVVECIPEAILRMRAGWLAGFTRV